MMFRGPYTFTDEGQEILLTVPHSSRVTRIRDTGHNFVADVRDESGHCVSAFTLTDLAYIVEDILHESPRLFIPA